LINTTRGDRLWLWAALIMTALKLWLADAQPVTAVGFARHDDALFVSLAESILHGNWLGTYDNITLAKGSFFPCLIAAAQMVGISLFLAQHLVYAGACAALVRATRPAIASAAARFAIYALLLWNPVSYDAANFSRVLRQHVYASLGLLVFAGLVALYLRRGEKWARQLPWAALLGLSFAAFYLTREETLWILPSMVLLGGSILFVAARAMRAQLLRSLAMLGTAACCALLPILGVCALNAHYYGWFGTVEYRDPAFCDAYGALVRVQVGPEIPNVPVSRETREALYALSPSFAELRPHLEGDIGRNWSSCSQFLTHRPNEERQIGGGWFMWALRDAVAAAGHGGSATAAHAYYRKLADEINAACDSGLIPGGSRRSGFMPRWQEGQKRAAFNALGSFMVYVIRFRNFSAYAPPSAGNADSLGVFWRMVGGRIAPSPEYCDPRPALPLAGARVEALHRIGKFLRHLLFWSFVAAQAYATLRVVHAIVRRKWSYPLILAAAAWGGALANLLILAVIHVTSFPVLALSYCSSAYPLVLVFIAAMAWDASTTWRPAANARSSVAGS